MTVDCNGVLIKLERFYVKVQLKSMLPLCDCDWAVFMCMFDCSYALDSTAVWGVTV